MLDACCPRCRLLQPASPRCGYCGDLAPVELDALLRPRIEGVGAVVTEPDVGWRDRAQLILTALGSALLGGTVMAWTWSPAAAAAAALGGAIVGFTKQYWAVALVRRDRLLAAPDPAPPAAATITGTIADAAGRTVSSPLGGRTAVVVALVVRRDGALIARRVDQVEFWLVTDDGRRVLVTGALWLEATPDREGAALAHRTLLPKGLAVRARARLAELVLAAGDRIDVRGEVRSEQLPGLGYRDTLSPVLRGEPGAPLWVTKR